MVHWAWIPISIGIGVVIGFFFLAFMAVCREEQSNKNKKWWEEWENGTDD